ncbi:alpha/beta fold hydrolase [Paraclostridium bifermentans]|uniref:alpha/beta fold hydrolase n=1 Tax=Paraclostridium bifermentans TaxID=1490 RepID=UPI00359C9882
MDGYIVDDYGKIFYRVVGEGKPILFIHGGPGLTHDYFIPYLLDLEKSNNKLIFFDQRGNGLSSYLVNDEHINISQFTQDIETLRKKLSIEKMVLLGHSMGTFFALDYAKKFPQNVDKLILSNATPMDLDNFKKMNNNIIENTSQYSEQLNEISNSLEFKNYDSESLKKYLMLLNKASFFDERLVCNLFENVTITKEFMNNFQFINNRILNQYLNQISNYKIDDIMIPTLILNTEYDFIPIESSEYIKNRIMNCTVKTIYNSGHYPFIEKTKEFISEINQFVGD